MAKSKGTTARSRENRMILLAEELAEKQLKEGTASAQVITHYLKQGSRQERLKVKNLEEENKLLRAKTEALRSSKRVEELYTKAIEAMRAYSGAVEDEDYED